MVFKTPSSKTFLSTCSVLYTPNGVSSVLNQMEETIYICQMFNNDVLKCVVDVASLKLQGGQRSFGKRGSDAWAVLMQLAEGPLAFIDGYEEMLSKYSDDPARLEVIHKLFRSPNRHHFSRDEISFVNAVLTDITECLFGAMKHWVFGQSKHSPSLFVALVRICQGCWRLMQKSYLVDYALVEKRVLKWTTCAPLRYVSLSSSYVCIILVLVRKHPHTHASFLVRMHHPHPLTYPSLPCPGPGHTCIQIDFLNVCQGTHRVGDGAHVSEV